MQWNQTIETVDVHCAGEIGRVVISGIPEISGESIASKLHHINTKDDSFRRFLCSEPRSGPAGSMCLLLPPTTTEADAGLIILQPDKAHAMSGSNAICAVTAMIDTGMVEFLEPEIVVTLDTASGLVRATAACANNKVCSVTLDMPPAFVTKKDATVKTAQFDSVQFDLCFGGVFYALIDISQLGLEIIPENARKLVKVGIQLHDCITIDDPAVHPFLPELNGLSYVMFRSEEPDGAVRTCTIMKPGRVDRSPCGTGSNSNMAAMFAENKVSPGDVIVSRSIIGGEFSTEFVETTQVGAYTATKNRITGSGWTYARSKIRLDDSDPFPDGFMVSDVWGG